MGVAGSGRIRQKFRRLKMTPQAETPGMDRRKNGRLTGVNVLFSLSLIVLYRHPHSGQKMRKCDIKSDSP